MSDDDLDGFTPERLKSLDAWVEPRVVPEMDLGMLMCLLAIRLLPETTRCPLSEL